MARFVACVALFFVTPGVEELAQDLAHVVLDGHTFHDEGHEAPDHCCSGAFHFCSCHAEVPAVAVALSRLSTLAFPSPVVMPAPLPSGGALPSHARGILRPPTA